MLGPGPDVQKVLPATPRSGREGRTRFGGRNHIQLAGNYLTDPSAVVRLPHLCWAVLGQFFFIHTLAGGDMRLPLRTWKSTLASLRLKLKEQPAKIAATAGGFAPSKRSKIAPCYRSRRCRPMPRRSSSRRYGKRSRCHRLFPWRRLTAASGVRCARTPRQTVSRSLVSAG